MKKIVSIILVLTLCLGLTSAMADTMGLGMISSISASSATTEKDGSIQVNTSVVAVTLDADGKIASILIDVQQSPKIAVTTAGEVADMTEADGRSKMEKGDDYAMRAASPIGKELNEQIFALQDWCIGKTVEEVIANFATDADAQAGCTIAVDDIFGALSEAAANAK